MAKGKFEYWLTEDGLTLLAAWARDGLTDEQLATMAGITASTLYEWKKRFPEISEALKKGKEIVDVEVENALLKRAKGYSYNETKFTMKSGAVVESVSTLKEIPPDVGAIALWLKNRKPDKWRDRIPELQPDPKNNLFDSIQQSAKELQDAISEIQPEAASGDELVEPTADTEA